jgi:hypothetical protein
MHRMIALPEVATLLSRPSTDQLVKLHHNFRVYPSVSLRQSGVRSRLVTHASKEVGMQRPFWRDDR